MAEPKKKGFWGGLFRSRSNAQGSSKLEKEYPTRVSDGNPLSRRYGSDPPDTIGARRRPRRPDPRDSKGKSREPLSGRVYEQAPLTEWPPAGMSKKEELTLGQAMELICRGVPTHKGHKRPIPHASDHCYGLYATTAGNHGEENDAANQHDAMTQLMTIQIQGSGPPTYPWETLEQPSSAFGIGARPGTITLNSWVSRSSITPQMIALRDPGMVPREVGLAHIFERLKDLEAGLEDDDEELMYQRLYKQFLHDPEMASNPHSRRKMEQQITDLVMYLSSPDWIDFSNPKNQVVTKFIYNTGETNHAQYLKFFYQLLLSLELDLRINSRLHTDWAKERLMGQIPPKIQWNLALARRWRANVRVEEYGNAPEQIRLRFKLRKRQTKMLKRFAQMMKWPNLGETLDMLRQGDAEASLLTVSSHTMAFFSGLVLPGPTFPFLIMNSLIDIDPDIATDHLALLTHLHPHCGFQYRNGYTKCLSPNTKVRTASGVKAIRDVQVGDKLFDDKNLPVLCTAVSDIQSSPMKTITYTDFDSMGKVSFNCTPDHIMSLRAYGVSPVISENGLDVQWFTRCNRADIQQHAEELRWEPVLHELYLEVVSTADNWPTNGEVQDHIDFAVDSYYNGTISGSEGVSQVLGSDAPAFPISSAFEKLMKQLLELDMGDDPNLIRFNLHSRMKDYLNNYIPKQEKIPDDNEGGVVLDLGPSPSHTKATRGTAVPPATARSAYRSQLGSHQTSQRESQCFQASTASSFIKLEEIVSNKHYLENFSAVQETLTTNCISGGCHGFRKVTRTFSSQEQARRVQHILSSDHYRVVDPHAVKNADSFTMTLEDYETSCCKVKSLSQSHLKLYRAPLIYTPSETSSDDVPIDPYWFGFWLGAGSKGSTRVASYDLEVKVYIQSYIDHLNKKKPAGAHPLRLTEMLLAQAGDRFNICGGKKRPDNVNVYLWGIMSPLGTSPNSWNPIRTALSGLGLGEDKSIGIPDCYMNAKEDTRLAVLAGLIESDGSWVEVINTYQFGQSTYEHKIVEDAQKLAISVGIQCSPTYETRCKNRKESSCVFYLSRGCEKFQHHLLMPRNKMDLLRGYSWGIKDARPFEITDAGEGEYRPIEVTGGLFQLENRCITHNCQLTYWASTSIVGKVLAPTCLEVAGWIGPARPSVDLGPSQIARIRSRRPRQRVTPEDVASMIERCDPLGSAAETYPVKEYELLTPNSDDAVDTIRIEMLSLEPLADKQATGPGWFDASIQFAIDGVSCPLRLSYDVCFIHAWPCSDGPHPLFFDYVYSAVRADEVVEITNWGRAQSQPLSGSESVKERSAVSTPVGGSSSNSRAYQPHHSQMLQDDDPERVLVIEAFGVKDNEVLARAWCSQWELSAVVADIGKTCMACAIREAYAATLTVVILIEDQPSGVN